MSSRRRSWFLIRLVIYVAVVAVLFATRGMPDWRALAGLLSGSDEAASTLTIAGRDLAPRLTASLVDRYRRDYPQLTVSLTPGGTNQALEDLLNRRADAAFLLRRPTALEQDQLRAVDGDTAVVVPVAVGGLAVIQAAGADSTALDLDALRHLMTTGQGAGCARLYVPDPNEGAWDAACRRLESLEPGPRPEDAPGEDAPGEAVVWLSDAAAVADAVAADAGACGLISTLSVDLAADSGLVARPLSAGLDAPAARPSATNLATGAYPLYHHLYIACRARGGIEGNKFLTHLASDRGQRQVRRAGAVPARQVAREIVITREAPGS